jgi:hypothetical protein
MHKHLLVTLILMSLCCLSFVSTNVPLDHWSYQDIDKLIGQGLIDSSMMATKPVSRFEMARHIAEADEKFKQLPKKSELIADILLRLKKEFAPELSTIGTVDGNPIKDYAKPFEDPYAKFLYAKSKPDIENIRGDTFDEHSNFRTGFASRAQLFDITAFYIHPEYPWSAKDSDEDVRLIEAYGKLMLGSFEIQAGQDSMWWGPGYHGSMLMSNNVEPFKMIKLSNPSPVELPWIFKGLGPFKMTWFLTQLEKDRFIRRPNLTGLRLEFKPHPALELGLSRTMIFGGEGRPKYSLWDYWRAFLGRNQSLSGTKENDQLGGFDASLLLPVKGLLPAKSVKLYTDWVGEDEGGGLPSKWGRLYGMKFFDIFDDGKTDFDIEYANNHVSGSPDVFYNHSVFRSGYTYYDRIIGHFMGTDAEDLFFRLTHYLTSNIILGIQYDHETSNLSSSPRPKMDQIQFDLTLFSTDNWRLQAGYRYQNATDSNFHRPPLQTPFAFSDNNHILFTQITWDF